MRVLFVCMGNICRSPTAEGVFRQRLADYPELDVEIDSAGTHGYHVGHPPDPRAQEAALRRGVDLAGIRARQVAVEDFSRFDYVLAMDRDNLRHLKSLSPPEYVERIHLFLDFMPEGSVKDVPDPYYGGNLGFERVLDLIEEAVEGLLVELRRRSARRP